MDAIKQLFKTPNSYTDYELHSEKLPEYPVKEIITAIVKRTFIDLAISLAFVATTAYFVTPPGLTSLVIAALATTAINLLLRSLIERSRYQLFVAEHEGIEPDFLDELIVSAGKYLPGLAVGTFYTMTTDMVIHEGGHALAMLALYKNSAPQIEIYPFLGGETSQHGAKLNNWGKALGAKTSEGIVTAAGAALSTVAVLFNIGMGFKLWKSNPEASHYFFWLAGLGVLQNTGYAFLGILMGKNGSGDFSVLWKFGINPLASMAVTIGVPLLMVGICLALKHYEKQQPKLILQI